MLCKNCGTEIKKENRRSDDVYQCPGCGKLYRISRKSKPAQKKASAAPARKKQCSKLRMLIPAAIVALILLIAAILVFSGGKEEDLKAEPTSAPAITAVPVPTPSPTPEAPKAASVHFRAVGDVMSHKKMLKHALQPDGSYSYDAQFKHVKDALSAADYTIANLELTISADGEYTSYPRFRSPEAMLDTLKDCGVDFLTMANNHILDGYFDGLTHTVDRVEAHGFDHAGAYRTAEEAAEPCIVEINGIKFGFLAYTDSLNGNGDAIDPAQAAFCVKRLDEADYAADVQQLRNAGAEVVICLPHWGSEGKRHVSSGLEERAQRMVEAGVDIILGSHPHVVLPVNNGKLDVNGEEKDILIAWSMGNFISYMAAQYMDSGIILDFTVTRDENGKISIHDVGYVPVYVWGDDGFLHALCSGDFIGNQPSAMHDYDYERMKNSVKEISRMIGEDGITLLQH